MTLEQIFALPQYNLAQPEKERLLLPLFNQLTTHHRERCAPYNRILSVLHPGYGQASRLADVPFLPAALFKSHRLVSSDPGAALRTLTSSGTTGQTVSRIFVDAETARRQTIGLARILTHVLGRERLPMLLVESEQVVRNRTSFSARAAGVLGLMNFGRNHCFALDDNMRLQEEKLERFLAAHGSRPFLIFGFTFMLWECLLNAAAPGRHDLSQAVLIHSGGWKKLRELAISNTEFKARLKQKLGIERVFNFYGMVEQVGSVSLEGDDELLYPPNFGDVIIRDPKTLQELPVGSPGVIQVLSALPLSYPGHSILTEDLGVIHSIDANTCGRLGKAFSVLGRVAAAELRGCSDTYAAQVAA